MFILYYNCHKTNTSSGESYLDSPDWIKNKKATINLINKKDNKCFQYDVTVVLIYEERKKDPQRITKIKLFINKYNWEGINFPSEKGDWKKFEKNYWIIVLNILYATKEKIYPAYISKCNSNNEKQLIFLMTLNGDGKDFLAVKKLPALLR